MQPKRVMMQKGKLLHVLLIEQTLLKVMRNLRAMTGKVDSMTADNLNTVAGKT